MLIRIAFKNNKRVLDGCCHFNLLCIKIIIAYYSIFSVKIYGFYLLNDSLQQNKSYQNVKKDLQGNFSIIQQRNYFGSYCTRDGHMMEMPSSCGQPLEVSVQANRQGKKTRCKIKVQERLL